MAHRKMARRHVMASGHTCAPARSSRLQVALNDSATALSALEPTAPRDSLSPCRVAAVAKSTQDAINELKPKKVVVLGGPAAVSEGVEAELKAILGIN